MIIIFPKYTQIGASSRYRTYQYLSLLAHAAINYSVSPLLGDGYLLSKYTRGHGSILDICKAFVQRFINVMNVGHLDAVVIEYELFPFFPAWFEHLLAWRGIPYIVDYDDALFHQYDQHRYPCVRRWLGEKIATVMRLAEVVVVGNAYLADYAREVGARRVVVIPTVVDLVRYPLLPVTRDSSVFTIGWIGSPTTAKFLQTITPALAAVCQSGRARVRLIGSGPVNLPDVPVEYVTWSEATEVEQIRFFDVGIMPLPDEPWARGKCGFKLIQYMACGLPVVASPVGVNAEIIEDGINGYLATTVDEWRRALELLMANPGNRTGLGQAGRRKVEAEYSLQVTAPKFLEVISEVARGTG